jgi:acetate kinase
MKVLTINTGSSSIKYALYDGESVLEEGNVEEVTHHGEALHKLLGALKEKPDACGHRLVHGGARTEPALVTREVLQELEGEVKLAPLHLPVEIMGVRAAQKALPDLPQVVCFDTAFHKTMPDVANHFPLPEKLRKEGVRRYGFHGLSYESICQKIDPKKRAVIAHLGSGCSLAAVRDGKSIDTTMGFSPTGGVMMGTRTGDLDPGVLLYLLEQGYTPAELEDLVNHRSGLLGVSGVTSDLRKLPEGSFAIELFCYQVRKAIGSLVAALGGLDLLVFSGGIGEHSPMVREKICKGLSLLDGVSIEVIATDENAMIAHHTREVINANK